MQSFLTESLKDHTILWLFLTSIIGGIIGAAFKIIADNIISQNINLNREAREHFKDYNEDLRNWFHYFEKFLINLKFEHENLNWNRLLLISMNSKVLIKEIDKHNRFTAPYYALPHLGLLKQEVRNKVLEDISFLKTKGISIPKAF